MDIKKAKKMSFIANTFLLVFVLVMCWIFAYYKINFLVYFSIPTILVYILGYYMINKNILDKYIALVYFWIILYMFLCTICLGYDYGFHLYCMSLIPIIFITDYMAYQLKKKPIKAMRFSIGIVIGYLVTTGYTVFFGPVYVISNISAVLFLFINSLSVFLFLITYAYVLVKLIISSEDKLKQMALVDKLTGLYNRHYMLDYLKEFSNETHRYWLAMIDIDDFKKINDTYGHNGGDYILIRLGELMKIVCKDAVVSRWGGEEFMIVGDAKKQDIDILDTMRQKVSDELFSFENNRINVTITVGVAYQEDNKSLDEWIKEADDKLYSGKKSGKNIVVK